MITSRFPLGNVSFTDGYFSTLVGEATKQCYGVAAMAPRDMTDAVKSMVYGSDSVSYTHLTLPTTERV